MTSPDLDGAISAQLRAWAPSPEDIEWLVDQIKLRADDWARLALTVADDEEFAPCFDARWHD